MRLSLNHDVTEKDVDRLAKELNAIINGGYPSGHTPVMWDLMIPICDDHIGDYDSKYFKKYLLKSAVFAISRLFDFYAEVSRKPIGL